MFFDDLTHWFITVYNGKFFQSWYNWKTPCCCHLNNKFWSKWTVHHGPTCHVSKLTWLLFIITWSSHWQRLITQTTQFNYQFTCIVAGEQNNCGTLSCLCVHVCVARVCLCACVCMCVCAYGMKSVCVHDRGRSWDLPLSRSRFFLIDVSLNYMSSSDRLLSADINAVIQHVQCYLIP